MKAIIKVFFASLVTTVVATSACSDDDESDADNDGRDSPEETGSACEVADDCFAEVDAEELQGDALCLDRVRDGYCTHTCTSDDDCCAAEGECDTNIEQVCSPFESTGDMMCFLSCEPDAIDASGSDAEDEQEYCQREASPDFICRSSGGGSENRKVCVPGDCGVGASCADDADCDTDLDCIDDFRGGYCGARDCETDDDCPGDSLCITDGGDNFCMQTCNGDTDCSFCRYGDPATCSDDVDYADPDTSSGSVCVPDRR